LKIKKSITIMRSYYPLSFLFVFTLICLSWQMSNAQRMERSEFTLHGAQIGYPISLSQLDEQRSIRLEEITPFLAYQVRWETMTPQAKEKSLLKIRFSSDRKGWSDWEDLDPDPHSTFEAPVNISQIQFQDKKARYFQLKKIENVDFKSLRFHFFSPGDTPPRDPNRPETITGERLQCPCIPPAFEGRDDWCPNGNCPTIPDPVITTVTHLIVHHSAGVNEASDWAAVVRSIWNGHVNGNGWDDIGYNWLIDPKGVLYEGRGDNVRGAHFCGNNTGTMGVCVMGNYTSIQPSPSARDRLTELLSWKSCEEDLDPLDFSFHGSSGLNLFHISGHRDGCSTACPGDAFYPTFDDLRDEVQNFINICPSIAGPDQLDGTPLSGTSVELEWNDNTNDETGYDLERSVSGAYDFTSIATLGPNTTSYTDESLTAAGIYDYRVRALGDNESSTYSNLACVDTESVSSVNVTLAGKLTIFPNPAEDQLTIELSDVSTEPSLLECYSMDGRLLFTQNLTSTTNILDLTQLERGMYCLKVSSKYKTWTQKFVKQ
jgi:hypothetical protein